METSLLVKVTPNAKQESIVGWDGEYLKVKVTAPPDKGAANKAVIALLANHLGIPQRQVILLRGATSRQKLFLLEGVSSKELELKL